MATLLSLLDTYPSMLQPGVGAVLLIVTALFTAAFVANPQWFVPWVLVTTPIPKLYSVGVRTEVLYSDWGFSRVPGGSIADIVMLAGFLAVLLRVTIWQSSQRRALSSLDRWVLACGAIVFASLAFNTAIGTAGVDTSAWLYAIRYSAALVGFFLAKDSAREGAYTMQDLLRLVRRTGNVYIVLGLLFYFYGGGDIWVDPVNRYQAITEANVTGLFRTALYFFDYGYDFGLYIVLVVLLNVVEVTRARSLVLKIMAIVFAGTGVLAVLLLAERGNYLALLVAVAALPIALARARRRDSVGAGARAVFGTLIVVGLSVAIFIEVAPPAVASKIWNSTGQNTDMREALELGQELGLSRPVTDFLVALPLGDFSSRLIYMLASTREALSRPWGVGFWCELTAVGWFAHNDLIKIMVEMGVAGLLIYLLMMRALWREVSALGRDDVDDDLMARATLQAFLLGLGVTMIFGTAVIMLLKVTGFIWCLLGAVLAIAVRDKDPAAEIAAPFRPMLVREQQEGARP